MDEDEIRYEARTADGVFYDGFVIDRSGRSKEVTSVDEDGKKIKDRKLVAPSKAPTGTSVEHTHGDEADGHAH